ncbi:hypothetical protein RZS08_20645, partial [Arthrospira platensis SPKY1]|nr:hypothetical protein [Arthrospira platensis SPKY1]
MHNSDLYRIFQNLPVNKRRALRKFIDSPYHNLREDVRMLFLHLDRYWDGDPAKLGKKAAWAAVFPGEAYDDQRMRYAMSFLLKTIERFLIHEEATADGVTAELHLAKAYREMGLEKMTRRSMARARQLHERTALHDAGFYERS